MMLPWKVIFLGSISGFPSAGKILTCLFPILIKFLSAFEDRHYIFKIREGKFHYLVTNELRQIDGNEGRFLPISERIDAFIKVELDI